MITRKDFTPITRDVNGNPRYVLKFAKLYTDAQWLKAFEKNKVLGISGAEILKILYEQALKKSRVAGGRKYDTKQHPGCIVFQSYNLQNEVDALNKELFDESEQTK